MATARVRVERISPSGPPVTDVANVQAEPIASLSSYAPTDLEPLSAPLILRPAEHTPGLYIVSFSPLVVTAGDATVTPLLSWTAPLGGPSTVELAQFVTTSAGPRLLPMVPILSDGTAPIVIVCVAASPITGAPVLVLNGTANRVSLS